MPGEATAGRLRETFARTMSKRGWVFWIVVFLAFLLLPLPLAVPLIASRLLRSPVAASHGLAITGDDTAAVSRAHEPLR